MNRVPSQSQYCHRVVPAVSLLTLQVNVQLTTLRTLPLNGTSLVLTYLPHPARQPNQCPMILGNQVVSTKLNLYIKDACLLPSCYVLYKLSFKYLA